MTDYSINFGEELGLNANTVLKDVMKNIGKDDELIITMDRNAADNSTLLFDTLKNNGFEVLPKGGHSDDKYHIVAHRKKQ